MEMAAGHNESVNTGFDESPDVRFPPFQKIDEVIDTAPYKICRQKTLHIGKKRILSLHQLSDVKIPCGTEKERHPDPRKNTSELLAPEIADIFKGMYVDRHHHQSADISENVDRTILFGHSQSSLLFRHGWKPQRE